MLKQKENWRIFDNAMLKMGHELDFSKVFNYKMCLTDAKNVARFSKDGKTVKINACVSILGYFLCKSYQRSGTF